MNTTISSVTLVLGLLMADGSFMLGNVFAEDYKNSPQPVREVHPIRRQHNHVGYYSPDQNVAPTVVASVENGEVTILDTETTEYIEENDASASETPAVEPEILATDATGAGASKTETHTEEDGGAVIMVGKKKVSKTLAIGTIAGVAVLVSASLLPVFIIVAIVKKKKALLAAKA